MTNNKKKDNETTQDESKSSDQQTIELRQKNEQLQNEIEEMKAMMKQLLEQQKAQISTEREDIVNSDINESDDSYIEIPQNKQINVSSLFYGGMTLYGTNDKKIRFDKFGVTRPISYGDLIDICVKHRGLAEEGAFFIHNKDAVKALYLEDSYEKILDVKKIENLLTLKHDEIDSIMKSMTEIQKNTIENIVIQGIIDGDSKYTNFTKIDIINKHCKKNLQKIANERMQHK